MWSMDGQDYCMGLPEMWHVKKGEKVKDMKKEKVKSFTEKKLTPLALIGIGVTFVMAGIGYGTTTMGLIYTIVGSIVIIAGCLWFWVENTK